MAPHQYIHRQPMPTAIETGTERAHEATKGKTENVDAELRPTLVYEPNVCNGDSDERLERCCSNTNEDVCAVVIFNSLRTSHPDLRCKDDEEGRIVDEPATKLF